MIQLWKLKLQNLENNTQSFVLSDGIAFEVFSGDRIKIKKSDKVTKIIKLDNRSFIDNICEHIS